MDERVRAAIRNNVALYEAVFRSHGLDFVQRGDLWLALDPAPAYFSSAITLTPTVREAEVAAALADLDSGGVKDSFGNLDLSAEGFSELFTASWIYREPEVSDATTRFNWTVVTSPSELELYKEMHGTADSILPTLLLNSDVVVAIARDGDAIAGGAILNRSGAEIGVSNLFSIDPHRAAIWKDLPIVAATHNPGRAIVGYERGDDLDAAIRAGFSVTGSLRIWVK